MSILSRTSEIYKDLIIPELLCYVSIDIAGSTSYKTKCMNSNKEFVKTFDDFFTIIPDKLVKAIKDFQRNLNKDSDRFYTQFNDTYKLNDYEFKIDKLIGDEVILKSRITSFYSIPIILLALRNAIKEYRKALYKINRAIDLKATVWIAQCPLINNKIAVELHDYKEKKSIVIFDCIGPSMDIGYRLSKYSTKDYITISVEVAYILGYHSAACHELFNRSGEKHIKIKHRRPEILKGVFDGIPYPIIQIENLTEIEEKRQVMTKERSTDANNLQEYVNYCEAFICAINNERLICKPFILRQEDKILHEENGKGEVPEIHKEYLESNDHYNFIIKKQN